MKKNLKRRLALVSAAAAGLVLSGAAMADTTDPGITAITALGATATSYITAAFGVAVLSAGGFWGISMMKKAFSSAK